MPPLAKFLVGLLGVGLLTWLWLGPLGEADAIADDIENRTSEALATEGAEDVAISVPHNPVRRVVMLEGDFPNGVRAEMLEIARAQRGVAGAEWIVEEPVETAELEAASTAATSECLDAVNAAIASDRIQFRSGSPYLNPAAHRLLDRIAAAARDCPGVRIEIAGHSSGTGREGVNMEMSAFRATTVRDALIERGVPAGMLTTIGKGSAEPLGGNSADPANRRVEFTASLTSEGDAS
jgi:OOP family OmpA-OmpF porin